MEEEIWKDINGYEGLYKISNFGRVKSLARWTNSLFGKPRYLTEKIMTIQIVGGGYHSVRLCKNGTKTNFKIHRLVATHFISNPNNLPQVNHLSGIKKDNSIENLEWCNALHNMRHAWKMGLINNQGENCTNSKLTDQNILDIRQQYNKGLSYRQLSKKFSVSLNCIYNIINRKTWNHLGGRKNRVYKGKFSQKLNKDNILEIRTLHENGLSNAEISRRFKVSDRHISAIVRRQKWKHI